MLKEIKARFKPIAFNAIFFIGEQYLKELFTLVHIIISNISPDLFTFVMIVIVAIIVSILGCPKNDN